MAPSGGLLQVVDRHGVLQAFHSLAGAVAGKIAYVSGDRKREGIFASLSIFENMVMPLYREKKRGGILGIIDRATLAATFKREADKLLIKFGLSSDRITSLSGGNQQKVLIGRGFAMRPDVMVLNDPARGIDVSAKAELYKHLRDFAAEGKSVVYMSSELEEFIGFATRVIVFRDGQPYDAFDGRRLDPKAILEAMFGQTGGRGLNTPHGPTPSRFAMAQGHAASLGLFADDVRVTVAVPPELRAVSKDQASPSTQPQELHLAPHRAQPGARKIKIVEFGGEKARTSGNLI
jgi:ribose transport system ATP-binding protein